MKKLIALLLAMLMVMGLFAGCGDNAGANNPTTDNPAATDPANAGKTPVTISWWSFESDVQTPKMEAWAERLHETYPWITIEWTWLPADTGPEKLTVAYATETYPDVINDMYGRLAPAVDGGLTISLQPAIDNIPGLTPAPEGIVNGDRETSMTRNITSSKPQMALDTSAYFPDFAQLKYGGLLLRIGAMIPKRRLGMPKIVTISALALLTSA